MARSLTETLPSMGFCDGCGKWRALRNLRVWVKGRIGSPVATSRCADCMPGQKAADPQAEKAARLRAGAQQIVQPSERTGARPDAREENGSVYCGRPRMASAKHRQMREAAYGDKSKFDSAYTWQG